MTMMSKLMSRSGKKQRGVVGGNDSKVLFTAEEAGTASGTEEQAAAATAPELSSDSGDTVAAASNMAAAPAARTTAVEGVDSLPSEGGEMKDPTKPSVLLEGRGSLDNVNASQERPVNDRGHGDHESKAVPPATTSRADVSCTPTGVPRTPCEYDTRMAMRCDMSLIRMASAFQVQQASMKYCTEGGDSSIDSPTAGGTGRAHASRYSRRFRSSSLQVITSSSVLGF
jgi:hypothetical protein